MDSLSGLRAILMAGIVGLTGCQKPQEIKLPNQATTAVITLCAQVETIMDGMIEWNNQSIFICKILTDTNRILTGRDRMDLIAHLVLLREIMTLKTTNKDELIYHDKLKEALLRQFTKFQQTRGVIGFKEYDEFLAAQKN